MTFSDEVKEMVIKAQGGFCRKKGCVCVITSIHHKLKNDKPNRKNYPHLIHSLFNAVGLCQNHHTNYDYEFKITEKEAQMYENVLKEMVEE